MTAHIYHKIQNTYAPLGNKQNEFVSPRVGRKGNNKSVFRIDCTKMLLNFVILYTTKYYV